MKELFPILGLEKIELDVGCVECRHRHTVLLQVFSNGAQCFLTGKISNQRHNPIFGLKLLDGPETFFGGHVAVILSFFVRLKHQFGVAWKAAPAVLVRK